MLRLLYLYQRCRGKMPPCGACPAGHSGDARRGRPDFCNARLCDGYDGPDESVLDHTGYFYMVHRPYPEMFQKSALVVSTAAGAGTKDANASVIRSLKHWGVRRIYSCGISIFAPGWDAIPASRKRKIEKRLDCVTDAFWRSLGAKKRPTMHTRLLFFAMKQMQKRKKGTGADATYWKQQGWLDGKKPF